MVKEELRTQLAGRVRVDLKHELSAEVSRQLKSEMSGCVYEVGLYKLNSVVTMSVKAPGFKFQPLNLKCKKLVSKFAFKFNLYRYAEELRRELRCQVRAELRHTLAAEMRGGGGVREQEAAAAGELEEERRTLGGYVLVAALGAAAARSGPGSGGSGGSGCSIPERVAAWWGCTS